MKLPFGNFVLCLARNFLNDPAPEFRDIMPNVSFSQELSDAIDSAVVSMRQGNDEGPRVMVRSPALRGAFIFDRDEAERRIRLAFPELSDLGVRRGVNHLSSRVRLACTSERQAHRRPSWVHDWRQ